MNVIHVRGELIFIPDMVFPEAVLPDARFANRSGETMFDKTPACRKIMRIIGQCPDCMEMIREDGPGNRLEGMIELHTRTGAMKRIDPINQQPGPPVIQTYSEGVSAAGNI